MWVRWRRSRYSHCSSCCRSLCSTAAALAARRRRAERHVPRLQASCCGRINFFVAWCPALLSAARGVEQLRALLSSGSDAPVAVTLATCCMQLGHATDFATSHARPRSLVASASLGRERGRQAMLGAHLARELRLLGDYDAAIGLIQHARRCAGRVRRRQRLETIGTGRLLPAPVDFYWIRDMSSGVTWPRSADGKCTAKRGWAGPTASGNSTHTAKREARTRSQEVLEVAEVAKRLEGQLNASFLGSGIREVTEATKYLLRARVLEEVGGVRRANEDAVGGEPE